MIALYVNLPLLEFLSFLFFHCRAPSFKLDLKLIRRRGEGDPESWSNSLFVIRNGKTACEPSTVCVDLHPAGGLRILIGKRYLIKYIVSNTRAMFILQFEALLSILCLLHDTICISVCNIVILMKTLRC